MHIIPNCLNSSYSAINFCLVCEKVTGIAIQCRPANMVSALKIQIKIQDSLLRLVPRLLLTKEVFDLIFHAIAARCSLRRLGLILPL